MYNMKNLFIVALFISLCFATLNIISAEDLGEVYTSEDYYIGLNTLSSWNQYPELDVRESGTVTVTGTRTAGLHCVNMFVKIPVSGNYNISKIQLDTIADFYGAYADGAYDCDSAVGWGTYRNIKIAYDIGSIKYQDITDALNFTIDEEYISGGGGNPDAGMIYSEYSLSEIVSLSGYDYILGSGDDQYVLLCLTACGFGSGCGNSMELIYLKVNVEFDSPTGLDADLIVTPIPIPEPSADGSDTYILVPDKQQIDQYGYVDFIFQHTTENLLYDETRTKPELAYYLDNDLIGLVPVIQFQKHYYGFTMQFGAIGKYTFTSPYIEHPVEIYVGVTEDDYIQSDITGEVEKCAVRINIVPSGTLFKQVTGVDWGVAIRHPDGTVTSNQKKVQITGNVIVWLKKLIYGVSGSGTEIPMGVIQNGASEIAIVGNYYDRYGHTVQKIVYNTDTFIKCGSNSFNVVIGNALTDDTSVCNPACGEGYVCRTGSCVPDGETPNGLSCSECQTKYNQMYPQKIVAKNINAGFISTSYNVNSISVWCPEGEKEVPSLGNSSSGLVAGTEYVYKSPSAIISQYPECGTKSCFQCDNTVKPPKTPDEVINNGNQDELIDKVKDGENVDPYSPLNPEFGEKGTLVVRGYDTKDGQDILSVWKCPDEERYEFTVSLHNYPEYGQIKQNRVYACNAQNGLVAEAYENVPVGAYELTLTWAKPINGVMEVKQVNQSVYVKPISEGTTYYDYDFKNIDFNVSDLSVIDVHLMNTDKWFSLVTTVSAKAMLYEGMGDYNLENKTPTAIIPESSLSSKMIKYNDRIDWKGVTLQEGNWVFDITLNGQNRKFFYMISQSDFDRGYIELDFAQCLSGFKIHTFNSGYTDEEVDMRHSYTFTIINDKGDRFQQTVDKEGLFNADGDITYTIPKDKICIYDHISLNISVYREDGKQWTQTGTVSVKYLYSDDATYEFDFGTGVFGCVGAGCGGVDPDPIDPPIVPIVEYTYVETWLKIDVGKDCPIEKLKTHTTEVDVWWFINGQEVHAPIFKNGQWYKDGQVVTQLTPLDHILVVGSPIAQYYIYNEYEQGGSVLLRYWNDGLPVGNLNYSIKIDEYEKSGTLKIVTATAKTNPLTITVPCGAMSGSFFDKLMGFLSNNLFLLFALAIVAVIIGIILSVFFGQTAGMGVALLFFLLGVAFLWTADISKIGEVEIVTRSLLNDLKKLWSG